jgi:hypothetical protein
MFLSAVVVEMDENVDASLVSRTTLERHRKKNRTDTFSSIRTEVSHLGDVHLVAHWDAKMLVNSIDPKDLKSKVERHCPASAQAKLKHPEEVFFYTIRVKSLDRNSILNYLKVINFSII